MVETQNSYAEWTKPEQKEHILYENAIGPIVT